MPAAATAGLESDQAAPLAPSQPEPSANQAGSPSVAPPDAEPPQSAPVTVPGTPAESLQRQGSRLENGQSATVVLPQLQRIDLQNAETVQQPAAFRFALTLALHTHAPAGQHT